MKMRRLLMFFFSLFLFLGLSCGTFALEDARVVMDFDSEYVVTETNNGSAKIEITFTNEGEVATILAEYSLNLGNIDPSNVEVKYAGDDLPFTLSESSGMVVEIGLGDILLDPDTPETIIVRYDVNDFFSEIGGGYDVSLPVFDGSARTNGGSAILKYPSSFGKVNYSSITGVQSSDDTNYIYEFSSEEDASVYISVGDRRNFSFNMERKLENTTENYTTQEILLPIDSANQTIVISNISPYPNGVDITDDGNLYITYNIAPDDLIWVRIQGVIVTKMRNDGNFVLSSGEKAVHLDKTMSLWRITDKDILADVEAAGDNLGVREKVSWIYDYLLENLNLNDNFRDLHSFEYRKGADVALSTYKDASAEDFADAFVALARLLDVPSRVVCGYVFPHSIGGEQVGMYHVWAQYWSDEYEWVSIDPAYELYSGYNQKNGTGLDRVIMAVYPSSISDFSLDETSGEVFLTQEEVDEVSDLVVGIDIEDEIQAGLKTVGTITLYNNGNTIIRNISFSDIGGDLEIAFGDQGDREVLLPGESFDYNFRVYVSEWHISGNKNISVEVISQMVGVEERTSAEKKVSVVPLKWAEPVTWVITTVLFFISTGLLYLVYKVGSKHFPALLSKLKRV